ALLGPGGEHDVASVDRGRRDPDEPCRPQPPERDPLRHRLPVVPDDQLGRRQPRVLRWKPPEHPCTKPLTMFGENRSNKYPPAKPEVLRLLAPQRGLIAIAKSKP